MFQVGASIKSIILKGISESLNLLTKKFLG